MTSPTTFIDRIAHFERGTTVNAMTGQASFITGPAPGKEVQRLKEDPEFKAAAQKAYDVTADELRQFVEQFESLEAEKKDIAAQQKDVMAEAKARGYDTKVLKLLIALRKRDKNDVAEEQAILDIYKDALGMS